MPERLDLIAVGHAFRDLLSSMKTVGKARQNLGKGLAGRCSEVVCSGTALVRHDLTASNPGASYTRRNLLCQYGTQKVGYNQSSVSFMH